MSAMARIVLGIDVGGSSIKGGLIDVETDRLQGELVSVPTPRPAAPEPVMQAVGRLAGTMALRRAMGVAFPSVIQGGRARTAAHIHPSWIDIDAAGLAACMLDRRAVFLNDADAAGIAEMQWGAGHGPKGVVIMLPFGTGIGTTLFADGKLFPNTELGRLEVNGVDAEEWASARIRTQLGLDWPAWIERVNAYLKRVHALLWPDVFILDGAVSERFAEIAQHLHSSAQIRPAQFAGQACRYRCRARGRLLASAVDARAHRQ
jgi:polyphosphate glucokinase